MGYSDDAYKKMMDLYNNHSGECGSQVTAANPGKTPTDCITYVINVVSYAFDQNGDRTAAAKVRTLGAHGTELAAYLVNDKGWKGVYVNPDVNHPRDKQFEHVKTYKNVMARLPYYKITIDHTVVNYAPTKDSDPNFVSFAGQGMSKDPTPEDKDGIGELRKIKFWVGVSRGGMHTWLYSAGTIYEVHWDKVGADLYGATDIVDFEWLSGAIVFPSDAYAAAKFDKVSQHKGVFDFLFNLFK